MEGKKLYQLKPRRQKLKEEGGKCFDSNLEQEIATWLCDQRNELLYTSRKLVMFKAKKMLHEEKDSFALRETFMTRLSWY